MNEFVPLIAEQMREQAKRWFTAGHLAKFAQLFIEEKLSESIKFSQLTVIHYHMFGGNKGNVYQAAAAVELFILASDILDDLQDQDSPSKAWMQVPLPVAIHVASSLLTLSQQAMLDCANDSETRVALTAMMNEQLLQAANGQMIDIMNEITDEQSYIDMVKQKSAALMVFACMTGVILAGHSKHAIVAEYAIEIGIAAQIRNDLRDLLRWDDKSDFLQRKRTLLTLFLVEGVSDEDRWIVDYFEERLSGEEIMTNREQFEEACERSGVLLYGSVMSRMHYNRFIELLDTMQEVSPWRELFLQVITQENV